MQKHILYVKGAHCNSCKNIIEETLLKEKDINSIDVNLAEKQICIGMNSKTELKDLAEKLSPLVEHYGYVISTECESSEKEFGDFVYALPLGLIILTSFFLLQRSDIINFGFDGKVTLTTAMIIGVIASLSTCLAVVGGLVLSLSAEISKDVNGTKPFTIFHTSRIVGFIILGGILGAIGGFISMNNIISSILGILVSLVMIILGLNLTNILPQTKKLQMVLPKNFFDKITKIENSSIAPLIIGAGTFFLPCGFTQSMQIASLSSGSFLGGASIMGAFALGTFPMLAVLSFGTYRFANSKYAPIFFKTSGIIILGLGGFSLLSGLASFGIIPPLFNL